MTDFNNEFLEEHKHFRIKNKKLYFTFLVSAVLVAIIVFWCLKLVGITITGDAFCGLDEHSHSEECYDTQLICNSSDEEMSIGAGGDIHNHDNSCYNNILICTKTEHTHSSECFPDNTADVETVSDWLSTFSDVEITNSVSDNITAIAVTQIGYNESVRNFELDSTGNKHGYTRYGEWYGNPYAEWNTLFVSFCLNYANANDSDSLESANAEIMRTEWDKKHIYSSAENYHAQKGDIVFFDLDSDSKADRTGIVLYNGPETLVVIEGDVQGTADKVVYTDRENIIGYGMTSELYAANHLTESTSQEDTSSDKSEKTDSSGIVKHYIKQENTGKTENTASTTQSQSEKQDIFNSGPLTTFSTTRSTIDYTYHLEGELVDAVFKDQAGEILGNGSSVYIGQTYTVSLEFCEINTGSNWIQFRHNEDGYLTYHIPESIHCEPFTSWHPISATTENGTIENVGEYFVDESGLLRVKFFNDENGVNFVEKYTNVDFSIDFDATVASTQSGSSTEVVFNDKIKVNLTVDGTAAMSVSKTHGEYDSETHTMEYTIRVESTKGVVKDLVIDDQIWDTHFTLRDTILVTDLDGNILDPQPVVSNHPSHNSGADEGFRISGFPDFQQGQGFLITYKTQIYDYLLSNESVSLWNGLDSTAKDTIGNTLYQWSEDWTRIELEKISKDGKQSVLTDSAGNTIPVIEWEVAIIKNNHNLQGTVVIDTLGEGLAYYTDKSIHIRRYDEWGNRLSDVNLSWNDVTINGNSMSFALPDGYAFDIFYYTTYEDLDDGEEKHYTNSVKATINGKEETAGGAADVVGFIPRVGKSASGDDGEYIYFTIEADVPSVIKNWGNFYLTDLSAFWSYNNDVGYLYVENNPEDVVITATTESGQTITFTPYVEGGPIENTYILVAPAGGDQYHSFNIFFNTAVADIPSSKWILDENSTLTITYKLPFDSKTGIEWEGELTGGITVEDALLNGYTLANEAFLNYTDVISGTGVASYDYSPLITKKAVVKDNGTIDYTVVFRNTIPGSYGSSGYINSTTDMLYFNDTFDERLEYVPGSLKVTCYDPWRNYLWLNKYTYNGTVSGNSMSIPANQILFSESNPEASAIGWGNLSGMNTLQKYYQWTNAGGNYEFTYSLRVKDEYLYTTEHAMFELDNTAELTWDKDGSSGPVTETAEYETGLIDKHVVQQGTNLDFDIHINRRALDILEGVDTLTIEDTMTHNLSVYWDTIRLLYEDPNGNWINFASEESQYSYSVTYDPPNNKLTFVIPDSLHIRIDYSTLITENGLVSVNNAVKIDGKAEVSDIIDAIFKVEEHSGGASGSIHNITLLKQDGVTDHPLPGAVFLLYGPMGDPDAVLPDGVSRSIVADNGKVLGYIGIYTTGDDGTVEIENQYLTMGGPYALVEKTAPAGYELPDSPTYFYFYETDPDGIIQSVTTLITIENFTGSFIIPETGGIGTFLPATIGFALTAAPILYSIIRRKRERRFL
ncbi:MAG: hypothetical protein J6Q94_03450 [Clostridia bacterium]|nr:hypothetical protein [Clostridia bacterium]